MCAELDVGVDAKQPKTEGPTGFLFHVPTLVFGDRQRAHAWFERVRSDPSATGICVVQSEIADRSAELAQAVTKRTPLVVFADAPSEDLDRFVFELLMNRRIGPSSPRLVDLDKDRGGYPLTLVLSLSVVPPALGRFFVRRVDLSAEGSA